MGCSNQSERRFDRINWGLACELRHGVTCHGSYSLADDKDVIVKISKRDQVVGQARDRRRADDRNQDAGRVNLTKCWRTHRANGSRRTAGLRRQRDCSAGSDGSGADLSAALRGSSSHRDQNGRKGRASIIAAVTSRRRSLSFRTRNCSPDGRIVRTRPIRFWEPTPRRTA
jgi:hypothetical protein